MAKKIGIIGDVHGKIDEYLKVRSQFKKTLQIGDLGAGFPTKDIEDFQLSKNHMFFRGNHDNPKVCQDSPHHAAEFGMWNGIFIVAGAQSIDAKWRTPGLDWWADEELSRDNLELMLEDYEKAKPEIVITHEAPFRLHKMLKEAAMIRDPDTACWGEPRGNSTAFALDSMLQIHLPKKWIFGHWHCDLSFQLKKSLSTQFICLDELSVLELEI